MLINLTKQYFYLIRYFLLFQNDKLMIYLATNSIIKRSENHKNETCVYVPIHFWKFRLLATK
jgi:hypothetical protein